MFEYMANHKSMSNRDLTNENDIIVIESCAHPPVFWMGTVLFGWVVILGDG